MSYFVIFFTFILIFNKVKSCEHLGTNELPQIENIDVFNGSSVNLICKLKTNTTYIGNYSIDSSMIVFSFNNEHKPPTRIINDTTVEYTIENVNFNHTNIYECSLNETYTTNKNNSYKTLCLNLLTVYRKIVKLAKVYNKYNFFFIDENEISKSFKCAFDPTPIKIICYWSHNNLASPSNDYNLTIIVNNSTKQHVCNVSAFRCVWDFTTDMNGQIPIFPNYASYKPTDKINFTLIEKNKTGEYKYNFELLFHDIIKPENPIVRLHSKSSSTLTIIWKANDLFMKDDQLKYEITLCKLESSEKSCIPKETNKITTSSNFYSFNNLESNSYFQLGIRSIFGSIIFGNLYGKFIFLKEKTLEKGVPLFTPNMFNILVAGKIQYTMYWKNFINHTYKRYSMDVKKIIQDTKAKNITESFRSSFSSFTFENILENVNYSFQLYGSNSSNRHKLFNKYYKYNNDTIEKSLTISYNRLPNKSYTVSWKSSIHDKILLYTVYWCPYSDQYQSTFCLYDDIEWIFTDKLSIIVPINDSRNYTFAFSASGYHIETQMFWARNNTRVINKTIPILNISILLVSLVITVVLITCYYFSKKFKKNVDAARNIDIVLPDGLRSSIDKEFLLKIQEINDNINDETIYNYDLISNNSINENSKTDLNLISLRNKLKLKKVPSESCIFSSNSKFKNSIYNQSINSNESLSNSEPSINYKIPTDGMNNYVTIDLLKCENKENAKSTQKHYSKYGKYVRLGSFLNENKNLNKITDDYVLFQNLNYESNLKKVLSDSFHFNQFKTSKQNSLSNSEPPLHQQPITEANNYVTIDSLKCEIIIKPTIILSKNGYVKWESHLNENENENKNENINKFTDDFVSFENLTEHGKDIKLKIHLNGNDLSKLKSD